MYKKKNTFNKRKKLYILIYINKNYSNVKLKKNIKKNKMYLKK